MHISLQDEKTAEARLPHFFCQIDKSSVRAKEINKYLWRYVLVDDVTRHWCTPTRCLGNWLGPAKTSPRHWCTPTRCSGDWLGPARPHLGTGAHKKRQFVKTFRPADCVRPIKASCPFVMLFCRAQLRQAHSSSPLSRAHWIRPLSQTHNRTSLRGS